MTSLIARSFFLTVFAVAANAATILVNFETVPLLPTGSALFSDGTPSQTVVVPNVVTFTGGVILGNETFLPAQSFGTSPNVYGTAGFDTELSSVLSILIDPSFAVDEVSFPVFNGSTIAESYLVQAFDGNTLVNSQTLSNLAANVSSGFGIVDLTAANITSVTITPVALDARCCGGWDYSIDSVALNESVQEAFTPEPGTFALIGLGGLCLGARAVRRARGSSPKLQG